MIIKCLGKYICVHFAQKATFKTNIFWQSNKLKPPNKDCVYPKYGSCIVSDKLRSIRAAPPAEASSRRYGLFTDLPTA